jgi:hypothetical protein
LRRDERPLAVIPKWLWALLALTLAGQLAWQGPRRSADSRTVELPPAPSVQSLRVASFGEPEAAARILALYIQSFDLRRDYARLVDWLRSVLELDPRGPYPLFLAARVYAESPDPARVRLALDFVYQEFFRDPNRRWPWLAHAALMAKHRLGDLALARRYASAVQRHTSTPEVPLWAKQMEIFILEDMNELAAAKIMIGGLLESGTVQDPAELRFLQQRLQELEARMSGAR